MTLIKKLLYWLISLSGLMWQVYHISEQYLKYETVSRLFVGVLDEIPIPRLQFAYYDISMIPNASNSDDRNAKLGAAWKVIFLHSPKPDNFVVNCSNIAADGSAFTNCGKIILTVTQEAIYSISYYKDLASLSRHSLTRWQPVFKVELNTSFFHKDNAFTYVSLKPKDVDVYTEEFFYVQLLRKRGVLASSYQLSYSYTKSTRLESPYTTDCLNYRTLGLDSQAHCYENCVLFASTRNAINSKLYFTRKTLNHKPVQSMVTNTNCEKRIEEDKKVYNIQCDLTLRKQCSTLCKKVDCVKEMFQASIDDTKHFAEKFARTEIIVNAPISLSTTITHYPQISIVDYITYILSCISFWLGISPLGLLQKFDYELAKLKPSKLVKRGANSIHSHIDTNNTPSGDIVANIVQKEIFHLYKRNTMQNLSMHNQITALRNEFRMFKMSR